MARVREDKGRESRDGFDGTWVAHPDLVPLAGEVFGAVLGDAPHQKAGGGEALGSPAELLDLRIAGRPGTEAGCERTFGRARVPRPWLRGNGAAALNNLMEDAATAEIARSQLWLWRARGDRLDDGRVITRGCSPRSATRSWLGSAVGPSAAWRRPPTSSTTSSSPTTSPSS